MLRTSALCLAFTLALPLAAQAQADAIRWSAHPAERERVQLSLTSAGHRNNQDWNPAELQGLDARFGDGALEFRIVRDAGALACSGIGSNGRGEGTCRFQRNAAYFDALARHGVRVAGDFQAWQLAHFDVKLTLLEEMRRQNYARPTASDLVAAGIFTIDAEFVRALGDAGFRPQKLDDLVQLRIHQITPDYIRAIRAAAPRLRLTSADLVQFRIHKVTPEWISGWTKLGYDLSVHDLANTRIHGVSPDYARAMMVEVRDRPTLDQLLAMRLHGVRPGR